MTAEYLQTLDDPRNRQFFPLEESTPHKVLWPVLRTGFKTLAQLKVTGLENLPPEGPIVLASNHPTNFDAPALQFGLTRPLFYMAKAELFHLMAFDVPARWLGAFPVYRGKGDAWAMQHARRLLENGQVVVMFLEGTRNKGRGLQRGKSGAARLALSMGCPIVPVAVDGTQRMFMRFPRRTVVRLSVGAPLWPQAGDDAETLTTRTMYAIAGMLPAGERGVYAR